MNRRRNNIKNQQKVRSHVRLGSHRVWEDCGTLECLRTLLANVGVFIGVETWLVSPRCWLQFPDFEWYFHSAIKVKSRGRAKRGMVVGISKQLLLSMNATATVQFFYDFCTVNFNCERVSVSEIVGVYSDNCIRVLHFVEQLDYFQSSACGFIMAGNFNARTGNGSPSLHNHSTSRPASFAGCCQSKDQCIINRVNHLYFSAHYGLTICNSVTRLLLNLSQTFVFMILLTQIMVVWICVFLTVGIKVRRLFWGLRRCFILASAGDRRWRRVFLMLWALSLNAMMICSEGRLIIERIFLNSTLTHTAIANDMVVKPGILRISGIGTTGFVSGPVTAA